MLPAMRNARRNSYNGTTWLPSILDDFFNDEFMGVPVSRQFATPAVNIRESEKDYDRNTAMMALKLAKKLGFRVSRYGDKVCPHCGGAFSLDMRYCPQCGKRLEWEDFF